MTPVRVIGIDPGPVPGIVQLRFGEGATQMWPQVVQCDHRTAPAILRSLLHPDLPTIVAVERFVIGRRSARSTSAKAGETTRTLIGQLREVFDDVDTTSRGRLGGRWFERSAVQVKTWATDERLEAAGLLEATKSMRHARDAARHAMYAAVHDGKIPDPLSRRAR